MGGRPLEGPTMGGSKSDWKEELGRPARFAAAFSIGV